MKQGGREQAFFALINTCFVVVVVVFKITS